MTTIRGLNRMTGFERQNGGAFRCGDDGKWVWIPYVARKSRLTKFVKAYGFPTLKWLATRLNSRMRMGR